MKYPDIFNPDLSRVGTKESQMYNIIAGRLMAESVKTSLGPRGMEKVYIDILGEATITKHGGAFLRKMDVDHPAAKAVTEAVNAVDTHVGDGTVTSAILIGAMLKYSQNLLERGVPTAAIIRGFELALDASLEYLEEIKIRLKPTDKQIMENLVYSCLEGKAVFDSMSDADRVGKMIIDAVCCVADFGAQKADIDDIKIEEKQGSSADIQLVLGTIIDKTIDSSEMPRRIKNAKILLINDALETSRTKTESVIEVNTPDQMGQSLKQETSNVLSLARKVVDSGANVVISRKGIGDVAQEHLAKCGIISIRRAKYNDLWWLEKSTGAKTCKDVEGISATELGDASYVYERNVGGDRMLFVESQTPKSVTLLLRSVSKTHLDEFHRTAKNAMFVLRNFVEDSFIVFGGGSCEAILAQKIRGYSDTISGREQLAVRGFADALEEIPMTLARNAGMSVLDALPFLRSKVVSAGKGKWYGIDSFSRSITDMSSSGIVETAAVKEQVLKTAVEATNMILNVDDVFMKDLIDNTHCHIDGTVHAHKDPGKNHNHWEQEGLEQRQMHHYY